MPNNFDLIRLIAATQVMVFHLLYFGAHQKHALATIILGLFPGVPFFFFTSGFLISASWERNPDKRVYAINRGLRIYPAYLMALLLSVGGILAFRGIPAHQEFGSFMRWVLGTVVGLPHFVPPWLHGYGLGSPNGALWTIPVEIFFYITVPVFYWLFRKMSFPNLVLLVVIALSVVTGNLLEPYDHVRKIQMLNLSPLNTIGVFCAGMLAQRNKGVLIPWAVKWLWLSVPAFIGLQLLALWHPVPILLNGHSRFMGLANLAALGAMTLGLAFTARDTATKLLHRQDISYGIYLVHWPLANMVIASGWSGWVVVVLTVLLAVGVAALSWLLVEKPMLRLKPAKIYAHD